MVLRAALEFHLVEGFTEARALDLPGVDGGSTRRWVALSSPLSKTKVGPAQDQTFIGNWD